MRPAARRAESDMPLREPPEEVRPGDAGFAGLLRAVCEAVADREAGWDFRTAGSGGGDGTSGRGSNSVMPGISGGAGSVSVSAEIAGSDDGSPDSGDDKSPRVKSSGSMVVSKVRETAAAPGFPARMKIPAPPKTPTLSQVASVVICRTCTSEVIGGVRLHRCRGMTIPGERRILWHPRWTFAAGWTISRAFMSALLSATEIRLSYNCQTLLDGGLLQ